MMSSLGCLREVTWSRNLLAGGYFIFCTKKIIPYHLSAFLPPIGFFGHKLRDATNDIPCIETNSESHVRRRWTKRFIRITVRNRKWMFWITFASLISELLLCTSYHTTTINQTYIFNMVLGISLLTYYATAQQRGKYRCNSVTVSFGDAIYEE